MLNTVLIGITILILLGLSLFFYLYVRVTPEEGWASAIMTILLLVYVTGLFGNAAIALLLVAIASVVGLVSAVFALRKKGERSIRTFFSPGIVMALGIVGVGVIAFQGMHICNWDELYQWGKAADYMVMTDQLPGRNGFSGEAVLLSSTTFFHYFITRLSYFVTGEITESHYYVSNLLLWFSALLLPFSGDGWKNRNRVWGFGFFHFMLTAMIFVQPYYNIYTDQATAYWAGGLIAWLLLGKQQRRNLYLIPLILINVGLMKSMVGPMFAMIVVMVMVLLYCLSRREKGERILPADWKKSIFSRKGLELLGGALSPVLLIVIWSVLTGQNGLFRFHGGAAGESDRVVLTIKSMIEWMFRAVNLQEERLYLSYGLFILITLGLVNIVYPLILDKQGWWKYKVILHVYIGGFAGFFLVMFVAYMMVFGYVDSIRAMSLNRYYSDYMMLGVVPLTLPLFQRTQSENNPWIPFVKKGILLFFLLCIVYGSSDYFLQNLIHVYALDTETYAEREAMVEQCEKVKEITGENGKIYFINQKKTGLFTLVADYELEEQVTRNGMCFNFREDTTEPILGLTEYPIETLPEVLVTQNYEYVWIYSTNEYFNENMESLFGLKKVKNGNFYRVINSPEGVKLEYIQRIK